MSEPKPSRKNKMNLEKIAKQCAEEAKIHGSLQLEYVELIAKRIREETINECLNIVRKSVNMYHALNSIEDLRK